MTHLWISLMRLVLVAFLGAGLFAVSSVSGATQSRDDSCRALSMVRCDAASRCIWVKSYMTKTGARIGAHCLAKNRNKSSAINKLLNGEKSSTTVTRIPPQRRGSITRNPKPSEKLR
ncbi:hypothetical protein SAMN04488056_111100 [Cohaesibacter marisflavi]|uniref:Uncharacterized protein n=1 Tax=Cohaesibacter marisflavi TaxID=655353 RepID=A0A1I5JDZ3_9HYPH|nr:hypothetical protein [Cohaesibacter marisflavi]SFO70890.1 hypothetical protein SAMN04488056_111100 [Cohaesibacter marisflavi]